MKLLFPRPGDDPPAGGGPPDLIDRLSTGLLADDMARFRAMLDRALEPQARYLSETELTLYRSGKKLRPMLLLLSARMVLGLGAMPDKVLRGAASLEMLHVATLIHDDIVDHADTRRGVASVNAARGLETAVIIGDMQFVQAIRGFVDAIDAQRDMALVRLVLDTAFAICRGELDELAADATSDPAALREAYLTTIERKTAVLFGLACEAGVALAGGRTSDARRAGFYGRRLGVAFQIMDDLFDMTLDSAAAGKPRGADLAMRRLSLPLIFAIEELGPAHAVSRIMAGAPASPAELAEAATAVSGTGGFARAYAEAAAAAADAASYLPLFPANRFRAALADVAHYVVDRGF